jgi:hypothetical protein
VTTMCEMSDLLLSRTHLFFPRPQFGLACAWHEMGLVLNLN